jgi:hypothetical protein
MEVYPIGALVTIDLHLEASESQAVMSAIKNLYAYCPNMVVLWNALPPDQYDDKMLDNFKYLMKNAPNLNIQYWYHYGHGYFYDRAGSDYQFWPPRSNISIGNRPVFSYLRSDFGDPPPTWYQDIYSDGKGIDSILSMTHSYVSTGRCQFKIVFIDTCWSGLIGSPYYTGLPGNYMNDMAWALGMYNADPPSGDVLAVYLGWITPRYLPFWGGVNPYDDNFVSDFWEDLRLGISVESAWFNNGQQPGISPPELLQISRSQIYNSTGDAQGVFLWPIP